MDAAQEPDAGVSVRVLLPRSLHACHGLPVCQPSGPDREVHGASWGAAVPCAGASAPCSSFDAESVLQLGFRSCVLVCVLHLHDSQVEHQEESVEESQWRQEEVCRAVVSSAASASQPGDSDEAHREDREDRADGRPGVSGLLRCCDHDEELEVSESLPGACREVLLQGEGPPADQQLRSALLASLECQRSLPRVLGRPAQEEPLP
mmetsp:Transcript_49041/g.153969  ORF Transcript_49041/g.153969 Transcript_49041/m.153969 type:complete len:206 (-) Transcript_49041:887-1504(-)